MIYAIDFGTSNSLLGAAESKAALHGPIPLDLDAKDPTILRSVMFFPDGAQAFFGVRAIEEYVRHGQDERGGRLIRSVKKFLPQQSFSGTTLGGKTVALEEIIGRFLGEMRRRANAHFGRDVTRAVLGRPARFAEDDASDLHAEKKLERAAKIAGFTDVVFCPEPIAAAYEFKSTLREEKIVLVADFGGGTSDFTVVRLRPQPQGFDPADVLSMGGLSVAGDALDGAIMRKGLAHHFGAAVRYKVPFGSNVLTMPVHLMEKICSPADISMLRERDTVEFFRDVQRWSLTDEDRRRMDQLFTLINEHIGFALFQEIERAKIGLGAKAREAMVFEHGDIAIKESVSAEDFEGYAGERIGRILAAIDETVRKAGLKHDDIDLICATGGSAKVPAILTGLEMRFGAGKVRQHRNFHSIVEGLTRFAASQLPA